MSQTTSSTNVTLSDVAKRAGVSQSTVSRVLNRHPRISSQTSQRVFKVVEKLGYDAQAIERKAQARATRKKTRTINIETLLCPLPEQRNMMALTHFSKMIEGIENHLSTVDLAINHISSWTVSEPDSHPKNKRVIDQLHKADGILMMGNPSESLIATIQRINEKNVLLGPCSMDLKINTVTSDEIHGGQMAAKYFLDRGFTDIGFLMGSQAVRTWQENRHGAKIQTDITLGEGHFHCRYARNTDTPEVARAFEDWILSGQCPRAVILPYVESFLAIELVLTKHHLKCPEDFSLIAFGDNRVESYHIKPTVLRTHPYLTGHKGSERIVQMILDRNIAAQPHRVLIPMEILEGNSVLAQSQVESG
ncbi:MAG: LacI family DNA-binding transcriptional regulator [Phycisphaeraceae bacterium JB051]